MRRFSVGLTHNLCTDGKKGWPRKVLRSEGGSDKIFAMIFCIRPPLQVFVNCPLQRVITLYIYQCIFKTALVLSW